MRLLLPGWLALLPAWFLVRMPVLLAPAAWPPRAAWAGLPRLLLYLVWLISLVWWLLPRYGPLPPPLWVVPLWLLLALLAVWCAPRAQLVARGPPRAAALLLPWRVCPLPLRSCCCFSFLPKVGASKQEASRRTAPTRTRKAMHPTHARPQGYRPGLRPPMAAAKRRPFFRAL